MSNCIYTKELLENKFLTYFERIFGISIFIYLYPQSHIKISQTKAGHKGNQFKMIWDRGDRVVDIQG